MSLRKHFASALFGLTFLFVFTVPGTASASDAFTMKGVPVDVTAATAAKAREQAIAQGQAKAFRLLLERLVPRAEHKRLPTLPQARMLEAVRDFAVEQEKSSNVRYIASLTVRFKPEPVRALLRGAGLDHSESMAKPILVLPMLRVPGGALLWEEANPWRQAFLEMPQPTGLVPMLVADGRRGEGRIINVADAAALDRDKLGQLARLYGAGDILLADAGLMAGPSGKGMVVEYSLFRPGSPLPDQGEPRKVAGSSAEDQATLFRKAAQEAFARIEETWKAESLQQAGLGGTIMATAPIRDLGDWLKIKERLGKTPAIQRHEVAAMMRDRVTVALHYSGDAGQLVRALAQNDVELKETAEGWRLRNTGSAP